MDELKERIEYLESISRSDDNDRDLLERVDEIEKALYSMLGVRKGEAERLAGEVNKHHPVDLNPDLSPEVKSGIVASRFDELANLTNELETQIPLEIPQSQPLPERMDDLIAQAAELGQEFDELSMRSAELTTKLATKLAEPE